MDSLLLGSIFKVDFHLDVHGWTESLEGRKVLKMKFVTYVIGEGASWVGCWLRG